jgi:hypothetical protein
VSRTIQFLRISLTTAVAVVALAACGGSGDSSAPTSTTSEPPVETTGTTVAPPTSESTTTSVPIPTTPAPTPVPTTTASTTPPKVTYTYAIATKGEVHADLGEFAAAVSAIYADPRGWSMGGKIKFERVDNGGDFTLWLSTASRLTSFSSGCSAEYSCRVGRNVIINEDRWTKGGYVELPLAEYRHLVINHETGHWLGLDHRTCPGAGQPAFIMQQQSKGGSFVAPCTPNPWPRSEEISVVAKNRGLA